ncbi:SapC family protein [Sphingomonas astaxanthinifaciens]|uniref:Peptidase n=1 Tax=Sphingomonas astaxanthinifaciens DSM 22298 TaxID=1123267 RepID=A0ABQ5Z4Q7_9SPHN|nr:SapC family protein [Sphingomonas astaxanthinifaciens]GLR46986.1 peptidase [Sphingomonas astaxanthinifaciens DSM 22298]
MASAAPNNGLPMLYNTLEPVSTQQHGTLKVRGIETLPALATTHAIPLTVDEFALAQRHFPIIFSSGDEPVPLALMGLNEGVNTFVDAEGKPLEGDVYMPAYLRRYPFLLARLTEGSDELSLCVDPSAGAIGDFEDGQPLFTDGQPSEATTAILQFCEQFEEAGQRTALFMAELKKADLLMDGEVAIQPEGAQQPFVYRGFQMVDEEKLRELRGDELRKMNQNGLLPLIYAHLFSLAQARDIFARQVRQGKGPVPQVGGAAPQPVEA